MTRVCRFVIAMSVLTVSDHVFAQDENCELAERSYQLAHDRLAEYKEREAAGWLEQAAELCPRFIYFQEFGEIRMQSLDDDDKSQAVDAFINAHAVAESDDERVTALFQYASLLSREGELQSAQDLVFQARQLAPANRQLAVLGESIQRRIASQFSAVRGGRTFYRPLRVASAVLRQYPWPPEAPSWRIPIDLSRSSRMRDEMSLDDVQDLLAESLFEAAYVSWSLYSAPGGFVMVTRCEAIDDDGTPLDFNVRCGSSDDQGDASFFSFFNRLFDAPEGYYRFIAFVVSDETYTPSSVALQESVALRRLSRGTNQLPPEYADMEFTERHQVEALIYEFRKRDAGSEIEAHTPGHIPAMRHLENSGLSEALFD